MKRILTLVCIVVFLVAELSAQPKPQPKPLTTVPAKPAGPRIPPPAYVLKKDFEPKIQELENKIRSAASSGASAREALGELNDTINGIGVKVQDIENLLNSANFKIALNSDSLKITQNKIDEMRGDMEKSFTIVESKLDFAMNLIYVLFALCILLPVGIYVMMMNLNKKMHQEIRNNVERMNGDIQKNYISQQDELKKIKSGLDADVHSVKSEINTTVNRERDSNALQFKKLAQLIETKMDKPVEPDEQQETQG